MKKYEVVVDIGSHTFEIEANDKEEAEEKAIRQFESLSANEKIEEFWVGDCQELEQ